MSNNESELTTKQWLDHCVEQTLASDEPHVKAVSLVQMNKNATPVSHALTEAVFEALNRLDEEVEKEIGKEPVTVETYGDQHITIHNQYWLHKQNNYRKLLAPRFKEIFLKLVDERVRPLL